MELDRRGFLESAAGAALATSIFTGDMRGANDKVNMAFIGLGRVGLGNLRFAGRMPGVNIGAVCDIDEPTIESAVAQAKKLGFAGVKRVKEFRDVLDDPSIDAVCISAPVDRRAYLTVEACQAGKDVWLETPACVYVDEAVKMVAAARKYGRVVQAGSVLRSGAFLRKARAFVKRGDLGEIRFCRAFQTREAGARNDWGAHLMDMVQFTFDEAMPLSICAQGGNGAFLSTYSYSGFIGSYESRRGKADLLDSGDRGIVFHGTEATLAVNRWGYRLYPSHTRVKALEEMYREPTDMHLEHWANFLECVRSRQKPVSDIETCVRSTTTCLLADLAYRHSTTLDWDDRAFTVNQTEMRQFLREAEV